MTSRGLALAGLGISISLDELATGFGIGLVRLPVDYLLLANTLHGVPDKVALSHQLAAALRPGGRLGIVNWQPLPRETTTVLGRPRGPVTQLRMSADETRAVVEPAGFTLEALLELPPYHYAAVFAHSARHCPVSRSIGSE